MSGRAMKRTAIISFFALCGIIAEAQQTSVMSHYFLNPYLINPAMAGQSDETRAFFAYRQQWANIPGAPETQLFTVDGKLNRQPIGLGLMVNNDVTNVINRFNAMLSASYKLDIAKDQDLSFGMSVGVLQHRVDFEKIRANDPNDAGLLLNADNRTVLDGTAGLSYRYDKFRLGFAAEQLFNKTVTYENIAEDKEVSFALVRHYLLSLQYDVQLNKDIVMTPLVLVRNAQGLTPQLEANATFTYRDFIWTNLAYRHDIGVGVAGGVHFAEKFMIGYNYDIPTTDLRSITGGSHEFTIGMRLIGGGKGTSSTSGSSRALKTKVIEELKRNDAAQYEQIDQLQQSNDQLNEELSTYKQELEKQNDELEQLKKVVASYDKELMKAVEKLKVDLENERPFDQSSDYFLVVSAFRTLANAKSFQKVLQRDAGVATQVVQNDQKSWYFIFTKNLNSLEEARKETNQLKQSAIEDYIIGTPWVYKKNK